MFSRSGCESHATIRQGAMIVQVSKVFLGTPYAFTSFFCGLVFNGSYTYIWKYYALHLPTLRPNGGVSSIRLRPRFRLTRPNTSLVFPSMSSAELRPLALTFQHRLQARHCLLLDLGGQMDIQSDSQSVLCDGTRSNSTHIKAGTSCALSSH